MCTSDCKVLKPSDVKREYLTRLQELGAVHSMRFKDKLLAMLTSSMRHFPKHANNALYRRPC